MTAMPTKSDALARLEQRDVRAYRIHYACNLMAGHSRKLQTGPQTFFCKRVAMANAACLHANANLPWTGFGKFFLNKLKGSLR
jgi:hypothetical protein